MGVAERDRGDPRHRGAESSADGKSIRLGDIAEVTEGVRGRPGDQPFQWPPEINTPNAGDCHPRIPAPERPPTMPRRQTRRSDDRLQSRRPGHRQHRQDGPLLHPRSAGPTLRWRQARSRRFGSDRFRAYQLGLTSTTPLPAGASTSPRPATWLASSKGRLDLLLRNARLRGDPRLPHPPVLPQLAGGVLGRHRAGHRDPRHARADVRHRRHPQPADHVRPHRRAGPLGRRRHRRGGKYSGTPRPW